MQTVKEMQWGVNLPKERMEIPEGAEVYMYGNQKYNIWEFQKERMRKQLANDTGNFYTYSKEHLSLAFPLVNENEINAKAKAENEARWKTKNGFENVVKRTNWNEHPKKPDQAGMDDLQIPYVQQMEDKMQMLKKRGAAGDDHVGEKDFNTKFTCPQVFSDNEYFKTVHLGGDDMVL